jgi:signal transduction histidine kinase
LPVVSYLAVPVFSKSGLVIGGLFFGHPKPGMFREEHEKLVEAVAAQAAVALDNAKLYEEVKTLNAQKDEFIGFASHELKTPLTTANGYIQLANKTPELAGEFIPRIGRQLERLTAIITDLLDISRIHAGRIDMDFKEVGLAELIRSSVDALEQVTKKHRFECRLPVHDITIRADAKKIEQVIVNLVSNAVKYSPAGTGIILEAILLGDQIRVRVQDSGIGIAREHIPKIFNRFYRISRTANTAEGLGLGLYISQAIIEAHGGRIWVESEEGKGSVFYFSFPVLRAADPPQRHANDDTGTETGGASSS